MTKKVVWDRSVSVDIDSVFDYTTVEEACERLRQIVPPDVKLKLRQVWDWCEVSYEIFREETDKEYNLRLAKEKSDEEKRAKDKLKKEEQERKQYERLKKKYG